ncbi:MAG: putative 2OG-Fe(II) oxygenase [Cyanobacteriota bacterium]|nr:putative 2OG-Fe(II) oxygenase [Cyanobacteriota bacterium]
MPPSPAGALSLQPLFPLALGRVQLAPDPLDTALLLQEILRLRGDTVGNPLEGCAWTGDINGVWRLHRHPAFAPLVTTLVGHAWQYLESLGFERSRIALHIQRCWPVVSEAGQVVGRHHHPNAHLSAVYYLNGDGSGRGGCLRFFPPVQPNELVPGLAVGHGGPFRSGNLAGGHCWHAPWFDVEPQAGLLLLFPSRVDHAVLENRDSDDRRFSISLDLVVSAPLSKGEAPPEYLAPHPADWDPVADSACGAPAFREDGA